MRIHLWHTRTTGPVERIRRVEHTLDDAELARADAFRFERDRTRFIVARSFLREVLGLHLGVPPAAVPIDYYESGKPRLGGNDSAALDFNLSRTGDLAVCAVSDGRRVGVDIERALDIPDLAEVAARVLRPEESAVWSDGPGSGRVHAFYSLWTRKEALGKAIGTGISSGPEHLPVPVELSAGTVARLDGPDAGCWFMTDVRLDDETPGCLVVERREGDAAFECVDDTALTAGARFDAATDTRVPPDAGLIIRRFR